MTTKAKKKCPLQRRSGVGHCCVRSSHVYHAWRTGVCAHPYLHNVYSRLIKLPPIIFRTAFTLCWFLMHCRGIRMWNEKKKTVGCDTYHHPGPEDITAAKKYIQQSCSPTISRIIATSTFFVDLQLPTAVYVDHPEPNTCGLLDAQCYRSTAASQPSAGSHGGFRHVPKRIPVHRGLRQRASGA